ncbi:MAG: hypothetical protein CL456_10825 [Acidimicrobiaceae bacterium]|nr:hypothetical protein [Acidimicrobiaceae bacterium]|tara:strand:+ start:14933 stop:15292 length:360 start_codon:yes stop_codon:yes gene_type:complete
MTRRRAASFAVILWREIPAQVVALRGDYRETAVLSERFQHAIDRAASIAGLTETTAYVGEWVRQEEELEEDIAAQVVARAAELEAQHDGELLEELVQNGGFKSANAAGRQQNRVVNQTT